MTAKTCFFTGHRKISRKNHENLKSRLREEILNKINNGITDFIAGGALGFDTLAAEQVIDMREDYDFIRLILYLPCIDQDEEWKADEKDSFEKIKMYADEIVYITDWEYRRGCMRKRNHAMVSASSCGIAYVTRKVSGASQTLGMARKKGIETVNLAELI